MNTPSQDVRARADGPPSVNGQRTSPSHAHSPRTLSNQASASAPQKPSGNGDKSTENVPNPAAPPKFKMKRTGTNGLPPGHSVPNFVALQYANTMAKPSASSFVPAGANHTPQKHMMEISKTTQNGRPVGLEGRPSSRDSSQSTTTAPSRPTSAGGRTADLAQTASPQSIAMKRKWASGEMDGVAQKAAQTRRLNAERRMSAVSFSDNVVTIPDQSTPEPAATSSTPGAAVATELTVADIQFYQEYTAKAATTPSTNDVTPTAATTSASPQPNTAEAAGNVIRTGRPIILPPKKQKPAKSSSEPSVPHVPGTPFIRTLSGRPYNMVPNENGRLTYGFGALFPDGYAPLPDPDAKGPRWICPVRHCTQERSYLKSHGKHFLKAHQACLLNDDGDGVFSIVGYKDGQDAPVVVSRDPKVKEPERGVMRASNSPAMAKFWASLKGDTSENPERGEHSGRDGVFSVTPSGRPYTTFPNQGGRTFGVLIPDGYKPLVSSAEKPWVCPVRTCRLTWASQSGLGIHFAKIHGGCTFNDNLDGTLSLVGWRDAGARSEALVVSQKRSNITDDVSAVGDVTERQTDINSHPTPYQILGLPSPAPNVNTSVASDVIQLPSSQRKDHYLTPASKAQPVKDLAGGALEIWNYIRPYLTQFTECPDSSWVPELLKLPKVRDIVWNDAHIATNGFKDKVSRDVATMVVQVTGEIPPKTCSRCRDNRGPYGECIVISSQAPIEARLGFASCACCVYHGQGTYCTLKFWGKKRADAAAELEAQTKTQEGKADRELASMSAIAGSQVPASTEVQSPFRRSERVQVKEAIAQSAPDSPPYVPKDDTPAPPSPPPQRVLRLFNRRPEHQAQVQQPSNTDGMEIEDWELAPGRLRSTATPEDGEPAENIAFSKAYLTANQSVRVTQDVSFRVDVVACGTSLRWAATPDRMRICSVGAGKVKVRIQGEEEFDLGPHGMFRLLPGRSCVVLNRLYGSAVLHVTEVSDYS
ncbi:hypothetical protein CONLIGDRAFT_83137 [Coniochaeta ligniaria NRRL 30616]|uniref:Uncharacterized protein n=1 Tax=Coniochaeta ligniaria NRRL 30616 TaxID=1408157 RepID=A0A1J7J7K3_9PEZI|nr:hypothetical protein CONLIGDRAFT_83137 [Coniochaeta ligniaria NRRL 30616]